MFATTGAIAALIGPAALARGIPVLGQLLASPPPRLHPLAVVLSVGEDQEVVARRGRISGGLGASPEPR